MKKVLYNKFTKLILMVISAILIGSMLFASYKMVVSYREYCKDLEAAEDESTVWGIMPDELLDSQLENLFMELLSIYAEAGMDGVKQYYEYEDSYDGLYDTHGGEFVETLAYSYIIIADDNDIYSNFVYIENMDLDDNIRFVERYYINQKNGNVVYRNGINGYTDPCSDYELHLDSPGGIVYNSMGNMVLDGVPELNDILSSLDGALSIRLFLSQTHVSDINGWFDLTYNERWDVVNNDYEDTIELLVKELVIEAVILVVILVLQVLLCGKTPNGLKVLNKWESKATEIHLLTVAILSTPIIILVTYICDKLLYSLSTEWLKPYLNKGVMWTYIIVGTIIIMAILYELGVFITKRKNKRIIKDSVIVRLTVKATGKIKSFFKTVYDSSAYAALPDIKKKYVRKVVMDIVVCSVTIIVMGIAIAQYNELLRANEDFASEIKSLDGASYIYAYGAKTIGFPLFIFFLLPVIAYYINSFIEYKNLRRYNKVVKAIETIYYGNYKSFTVDESEKDEALKMLANLSENFEESVRKQVEAEKMQIELVANVSHDLKTPLTSIISYVELLKEEEMSDVAKDYVKVLSDKSDRLKDIVSDVFDLAKATSGEKVPMEELDGVVLVNQVLSDMQDKIDASGRELRTKITPDSAPLIGNGQKLYRVFQNIIDNALKYSMPGTRIYLTADMEGAEFVVTLKNVSEYEMDFTAEQVMSRFTRGDKSRHSEGNGLGLSIAKSFTELMGGTFDVEIDDDVFKTIVRLR